jgi:hypothetical protein
MCCGKCRISLFLCGMLCGALSVIVLTVPFPFAKCHNDECHYAEYHFAECRIFLFLC